VSAPKAVCLTLWFPQHNNPRYAALFPRLYSAVRFRKFRLSERRLIRALQYRLWHGLSGVLIYPALIQYLARRYETLYTVTTEQIRAWPRRRSVVVDLDDPMFTANEVEALNLPQVKALVVTTNRAKELFQKKGVTAPIHVIPQGVAAGQIDAGKRREIRARFKSGDDIVVGFHAPSLTLAADGAQRARGDQDDLDFLFQAIERAHLSEPRLKLWLFGNASESVKAHVRAGRTGWVKLFGYVELADMLTYLADLDIGVYPRTWSPPPGRFSVKIAQFMACGVPVVSTQLDEGLILQEAGSGVLCESPETFSDALVELARSPGKRSALGQAGKQYAETHLEWSVLMPTYLQLLQE
jgi:glycosyltransferase involved in cell wall biosynthesis